MVPGDVSFSTKPRLAAEMIERAHAAGVPFRWVAADSSMGSAISSGTYAKPVRAMYSASIPIIGLHPGPNRNGLSAPPRRSQTRSIDLTGGVCRPVPEPKGHDCTTDATSNWPISKAKV
jgi:hypothetical protein